MKTPNRRFKSAIFEQFARIGKAVASPVRLELLDLLSQGARHVESLAGEAGIPIANASQHLQVLRGARLVEADKSGLFVTYRLADAAVAEFVRQLRLLAESRLAEVEQMTRQFLESRHSLEQVDREELLRRLRNGEVTVLDVRPAAEYEAGHLPQALSIPLAELEQRLAELPRDREVVAYCRGPYCVLAIEAVQRLRQNGFRALRLDWGVVDWQAHGFRVEAGSSSDAAQPHSDSARTTGPGLA